MWLRALATFSERDLLETSRRVSLRERIRCCFEGLVTCELHEQYSKQSNILQTLPSKERVADVDYIRVPQREHRQWYKEVLKRLFISPFWKRYFEDDKQKHGQTSRSGRPTFRLPKLEHAWALSRPGIATQIETPKTLIEFRQFLHFRWCLFIKKSLFPSSRSAAAATPAKMFSEVPLDHVRVLLACLNSFRLLIISTHC